MPSTPSPAPLPLDALRAFFADAAAGMVVTRDDGTIVAANPAFCALLYRSEDWLVGRVFAELLDPGERSRRQHPGRATIERKLVRADAAVLTTLITQHASPDDTGALLTVLNVVDVTARARADSRRTHRTLHDPLTGLPTRALFLDRVEQTLTRGEWGVVAVIGLDHFRQVNDALGRAAGDRVLNDFARSLERLVGKNGTAARIGDDEFAIAAASTPRELEAIRHALPRFRTTEGYALTASVGVREFEDGVPAENLLGDAQLALAQAKAQGRDRVVRYASSLRGRATRASLVERRLRRALDQGEVAVHYQSIHRCADRALLGFEALARWTDAELGVVSPAEFIPVAEAHGMIHDLGAHVLRTALGQLARWRAQGHVDLTMSINLSTPQTRDPAHVAALLTLLSESGVPPRFVTMELTESVYLDLSPDTSEGLLALADTGVRLVIDDFGTGWSSFGYLLELPFGGLKIDRSFVDGVEVSPRRRGLVRAIVELARALDMRCVAEGVETEGQLTCLTELGVEAAQGFLFSRAAAADTIVLG